VYSAYEGWKGAWYREPVSNYRMPDGRPIFGEGSPHDISEHLDALVSPANEAYRKVTDALGLQASGMNDTKTCVLGAREALAALVALKPRAPASLTEDEKRAAVETMVKGAETFAMSVYYTQTRFESMQAALSALLERFEIRRRG